MYHTSLILPTERKTSNNGINVRQSIVSFTGETPYKCGYSDLDSSFVEMTEFIWLGSLYFSRNISDSEIIITFLLRTSIVFDLVTLTSLLVIRFICVSAPGDRINYVSAEKSLCKTNRAWVFRQPRLNREVNTQESSVFPNTNPPPSSQS